MCVHPLSSRTRLRQRGARQSDGTRVASVLPAERQTTDPDDEQGLNWEEVEQAVEDLLQENEENDEMAWWPTIVVLMEAAEAIARAHACRQRPRGGVQCDPPTPRLGAAACRSTEVSDFDEKSAAKEESMLKALEELPEGEWIKPSSVCSAWTQSIPATASAPFGAFTAYTECIDQWLRVSQAGRGAARTHRPLPGAGGSMRAGIGSHERSQPASAQRRPPERDLVGRRPCRRPAAELGGAANPWCACRQASAPAAFRWRRFSRHAP